MTNISANTNSTKENPDELYFTWYLDELMHYGFLKNYDREPETLIVLPAYEHLRQKHFQTKANENENFNLTQPLTYTYDFRLIWEEAAIHIFTEAFRKGLPFKYGEPTFVSHYIKLHGGVELVSFVDVKPHVSAANFGGGKLSTYYTFPLIQKFLMATRNLYINKVIPKNQGKHGINTCLFAKTFTPNRYEYTDEARTFRKIPWKKTSITSYVNKQRNVLDMLEAQENKKNAKNNQQTLL